MAIKTRAPVDHLEGIPPESFKLATRAHGALRHMAEFAEEADPKVVLEGTKDDEVPQVLQNIETIRRWTGELERRMRDEPAGNRARRMALIAETMHW